MKVDILKLRELWRIDDPQYTSNTERGEAIIINQLCDEIEQLRGVITNLDAHLDFSTPFEDGVCETCQFGFEDASGINDAMEKSRQALAGESNVSGND